MIKLTELTQVTYPHIFTSYAISSLPSPPLPSLPFLILFYSPPTRLTYFLVFPFPHINASLSTDLKSHCLLLKLVVLFNPLLDARQPPLVCLPWLKYIISSFGIFRNFRSFNPSLASRLASQRRWYLLLFSPKTYSPTTVMKVITLCERELWTCGEWFRRIVRSSELIDKYDFARWTFSCHFLLFSLLLCGGAAVPSALSHNIRPTISFPRT